MIRFLAILITLALASLAHAAPNLIPNSSLEVGMQRGWNASHYAGGVLTGINNADISTAEAHTGTRSAHIRLKDGALISVGPIRLKPSTTYTLSYWAKRTGASGGRHYVTVNNTWSATAGGPGDTNGSTSLPAIVPSVTASWAQYTGSTAPFRFTTTATSGKCSYMITVGAYDFGDTGTDLYLDDFYLEEGTSATGTWAPMTPMECGIAQSETDRLWFDTQTPDFDLVYFNGSSGSLGATLQWRVYNYVNELIVSGSEGISVAAGARSYKDLPLPSHPRGAFRIMCWLEGIYDTIAEDTYSVIPQPRNLGLYPASAWGLHTYPRAELIASARDLGFKWTRTLSPSQEFRWRVAEPTDDAFTWTKEDLQIPLYDDYGFSILATLNGLCAADGGTNSTRFPTWAGDGTTNGVPTSGSTPTALPLVSKWTDFVTRAVTRFASYVDAWEILNEPDTEGKMAWNYTPILGSASGARELRFREMFAAGSAQVRSLDPTATILLNTASNAVYEQESVDNIAGAAFDVLSNHHYPTEDLRERFDDLSAILVAEGKPGWNTEGGTGCKTMASALFTEDQNTAADPFTEGVDFANRTATSIKNQLRIIGWGYTKAFWYDGRQYDNLQQGMLGQTSIFDWTRGVKANGTAMAFLHKLLDEPVSQHAGFVSPSFGAGTEAYGFVDTNTSVPVIAIWYQNVSGDTWDDDYDGIVNVTVALTSGQCNVYDTMGNLKTFGAGVFEVGPDVLYITGNGINYATLKAAISAAATTDTTAPNLVLNTFPTSNVPTGTATVTFRWSAFDNVNRLSQRFRTDHDSSPNPIYTTDDDILFRYKLVPGDADYGSWVPYCELFSGTAGTGLSHIGLGTVKNLSGDGSYTFTLQAKDKATNTAQIAFTFQVGDSGAAPVATITAPANASSHSTLATINFTGTATDAEDGTITSNLTWSSSRDGALGTGGSINVFLTEGTHTITASIIDSDSLSDSDAISVTVNGPGVSTLRGKRRQQVARPMLGR